MLDQLSEKFADKLVKNGIIPESDADVYSYGFFQSVMMGLNITTTLLLGILLHMLAACVMLNLAYIPIRSCAGGDHADSPLKCYVHSTIMIAVLLCIIKYFQITSVVSISLIVFSSLVIWLTAPVESQNNPLDEEERGIFKRRTRIILVIEIAVFGVLLLFGKELAAETTALGIFTESLMLVIGLLKNKNQH